MATKDVVVKVWIEEGCIVCDACETTCPEVFEVLENTCIVRPAALNAEFTRPLTDTIVDAAVECPVDVIKYDTVAAEVPDSEVAAEAPAAEPVAAGATATAEAPKAAAAKAARHADAAASPPAKSAEAPAPAAAPRPSKAPTKMAASAGGDGDEAMQGLLKTSTTRGGAAGIERQNLVIPEEVALWQRARPEELPPDVRHARTMEAAAKFAASAKDPNQPGPTRREAMRKLALATGWSAFGCAAAVTVGPAFGRYMMPNVLEEPDPKVRVGGIEKYAEMAPGDVNEDFKPKGVWMIRQEGVIAALNIICTHLGCIPNWLPNDRKFKCPCHGSGFKPSGINFEGPAPRPLERFRIFEQDGVIVVDKSKKFQYERGEWANPDSFVRV